MIKNDVLRWSKFSHVVNQNGVSALYHSLRMKPIFIDQNLVPIIQSFGDGKCVADVLGRSGSLATKIKGLIPVLREDKILMDADKPDEQVLKYFQDHLIGHPYVSIVYFILTDNCNFGCRYCFIENEMPPNYQFSTMSDEVARTGVDMFCRLIKLKPEFFNEEKSFVVYGGEPLLAYKTLRALLEYIALKKSKAELPTNTQLSMVTNGTLATKEIAALLKEHHVGVAVSIDGDQASTNSCRCYKSGKPVFDDVVRGYNLLKNEGVDVGISCTLNHESVKNFDTTLKTLMEYFAVESLGFNLVLTGDSYTVPDTYDIEASTFILKAFEIFRKKNIVEDRIMRKLDSFTKSEIYPFDCGASGGGQIVIAPDGQVGICHGYLGTRKYFPTNVWDNNFDPSTDPVFQEWAKRSPLNMPECKDCIALGICGGGCPFHADNSNGTIWKLDDRFCAHAKTTLNWLIWDLFKQASKG